MSRSVCGYLLLAWAVLTPPVFAQETVQLVRWGQHKLVGGCTMNYWLDHGAPKQVDMAWSGVCIDGRPANGAGELTFIAESNDRFTERVSASGQMVNGFLDGVWTYTSVVQRTDGTRSRRQLQSIPYEMGCATGDFDDACIPAPRH
jgi:hypothetical protein